MHSDCADGATELEETVMRVRFYKDSLMMSVSATMSGAMRYRVTLSH